MSSTPSAFENSISRSSSPHARRPGEPPERRNAWYSFTRTISKTSSASHCDESIGSVFVFSVFDKTLYTLFHSTTTWTVGPRFPLGDASMFRVLVMSISLVGRRRLTPGAFARTPRINIPVFVRMDFIPAPVAFRARFILCAAALLAWALARPITFTPPSAAFLSFAPASLTAFKGFGLGLKSSSTERVLLLEGDEGCCATEALFVAIEEESSFDVDLVFVALPAPSAEDTISLPTISSVLGIESSVFSINAFHFNKCERSSNRSCLSLP
mmetsp:Transcript_8952/g.22592  ORF Transcript_8952/g.22592 Transcript_8952/m.22592 type:complete len:270 (+) Transcript_8952:173-982(+)